MPQIRPTGPPPTMIRSYCMNYKAGKDTRAVIYWIAYPLICILLTHWWKLQDGNTDTIITFAIMIELTKLLAITGMPGLYELIANRADGAIVKSVENGLSKFAPLRKHQFSLLETISIYTHSDSTPLSEVFYAMKKSDLEVPAADADQKTCIAYFQKILPDYDPDRVTIGDIKKCIKWYSILLKNERLTEKVNSTSNDAEKVD